MHDCDRCHTCDCSCGCPEVREHCPDEFVIATEIGIAIEDCGGVLIEITL